MGRRSLPKIDASLDLSDHLFLLDDLDDEFDPQSLFPRRQPLEIEIGSGKGHFLLTHSQANPEKNYLGNEIAKKYTKFAAYRMAQQASQNARIVSGDGLALFQQHLPASCAVGVHVYFPDPWWKERHRRRRVMQDPFVLNIQRVLEPAGIFHFWTDVEEYFEDTIKRVTRCSDLQGPIDVAPIAAQHDMDYRTHFERRMRLGGHDVFRAQFVKSR